MKIIKCKICEFEIENPKSADSNIYIERMRVHDRCYYLFMLNTKTPSAKKGRTKKQIILDIKRQVRNRKNE